MSNSTPNPPFPNTTTTLNPSAPASSLTSSNAQQNNELLLPKLEKITEDKDILDQQLRQIKLDYGDSLFRQKETEDELNDSRRESAELKTKNDELRLELKMSKQRCEEAEEELEVIKKKAAALEAENSALTAVAEAAKAAEEKALKEKEVVIQQNKKLEFEKDIIMDYASTKYKAFDERFVALETWVSNSKLPSHSSAGQAAPVSFQEAMVPDIINLDSD